MGVAVLTIVVSVLAGTLLALLPSQKSGWLGPLRTFGLAAALSVVVLHMVPESIEAIGVLAVPALLIGLALPVLLGSLGSFLWRASKRAVEPRQVALEAGYAGLLLHKVGDGIALGVYAGELHPSAGSSGFATALAAHIVPVVAIVVLTFDSVHGRGSALLRALGLGVAGLLGVFSTRLLVLGDFPAANGWLSAIAAGMLLHVVLHDLGHDLPKTATARAIDLAMAALGLLVSAIGGELHGAGEAAPQAFLRSFGALAETTVPFFLLALLAHAALGVGGPRQSRDLRHSDRSWGLGRALERTLVAAGTLGALFGLGLVLAALVRVSGASLPDFLLPPALVAPAMATAFVALAAWAGVGAVPLAVVFVEQGVGPVPMAFGLLLWWALGPQGLLRASGQQERSIGRWLARGLGLVGLGWWLLLWLPAAAKWLGPGQSVPAPLPVLCWVAALICAFAIFRLGFRGFLLPAAPGRGDEGHGHAHGLGSPFEPGQRPAAAPEASLDPSGSRVKIPRP